jgi:hypothetical protein
MGEIYYSQIKAQVRSIIGRQQPLHSRPWLVIQVTQCRWNNLYPALQNLLWSVADFQLSEYYRATNATKTGFFPLDKKFVANSSESKYPFQK